MQLEPDLTAEHRRDAPEVLTILARGAGVVIILPLVDIDPIDALTALDDLGGLPPAAVPATDAHLDLVLDRHAYRRLTPWTPGIRGRSARVTRRLDDQDEP